MVTIDLEPCCLECRYLEIVDGTTLTLTVSTPAYTHGSIFCAHARTCKHRGGKTVSQLIGMPADGEPTNS